MHKSIAYLVVIYVLAVWFPCDQCKAAPPADGTIRVATYNVSLYRKKKGQLAEELARGNSTQAQRLARVIQRVRPNVLLLCEIDYDPEHRVLKLFQEKYLAKGSEGLKAIHYKHTFMAPVNTGVQTKFDLDKDGQTGGPADAIGYGRYEGQYGMAVLSQFPIEKKYVRTFQKFLWQDMPDALLPVDPKTKKPYYSAEELAVLRLSSKSFWDVPLLLPSATSKGQRIHLLCSHPTPPAFDGPEDRNGCRNHDEVRLITDYITPAHSKYLSDDLGNPEGLAAGERFIVLGDLNADPKNDNPKNASIKRLLASENVHRVPHNPTADFSADGIGNMRVDYALPSVNFKLLKAGVFWPKQDEPGAKDITATDHRLVWVDIAWRDAEE